MSLTVFKLDKIYGCLTGLLTWSFLCFCSCIYYFIDGSDGSRVFYIGILVPSILLIFRIKKVINLFDYRLIIFLFFPFYYFLSHLWAPDGNITKDIFFHFRNFFCVLSFTLSSVFLFKLDINLVRKLINLLIFVGFLSALVSLCYYFYHHGFTYGYQLKEPFTDNPNKAGSIYLLGFVICLSALMFKRNSFKNRFFFISSVLSLFVYLCVIFYSQTLVPLLILPTLFFAFLLWKRKYLLFALLGISLLVYTIGFSSVWIKFWESTSVQIRLELIRIAIEQMQGRYLFGVGLSHKLFIDNSLFTIVNPHPHNIFIDCFRFGGVVGVLFFLGHLVVIFRLTVNAIKTSKDTSVLLVWFVCGIILMTFYSQQPLTRPGGYIWFLYWIPAVLLFAHSINLSSDATYESH